MDVVARVCVEDELGVQALCQLRLTGDVGERGQDEFRITDGGQGDKADTLGKRVLHSMGCGEREMGFADATRTRQGQQAHPRSQE